MWQQALHQQHRLLHSGSSQFSCPAWLPVYPPRASRKSRCSAADTGVLHEVRISLSDKQDEAVLLQDKAVTSTPVVRTTHSTHEQAAAADMASATAHAAVAAANRTPTPDSEIQEELKECDCWEDVLDIVGDEAMNMSASSVYTALRRLCIVTKGLPYTQTKQLVQQPAFQLLLTQLQSHLPSFDAFMLTNSLYSLSVLRSSPSKELLAAYDVQVQTHLESFNHKDVVQCFYAYASLKHTPSKQLLDRLSLQAEHFVSTGQCNAQDVSMLLWSCGTLHHKHSDLLPALVNTAIDKFPTFSSQGIANTTWALAKLDTYNAALMSKVVDHLSSSSNLKGFRPQEVFNTLWGLAHLRHHPQQALPTVTDYATHNIHRLRPVDLANFFYVLGMFSHHPGAAAMGKLLPKVDSELHRFGTQELANVYWGLALLEEVQHPVYVRMTAALQQAYEEGQLGEGLQRQVFTGFLSAKLAGVAVSLPAAVLEALKACWISSVHAGTPSDVLEDVAKQLRALRVRHDMKKATRDGLSSVHIALNPTPSRFVALQLVPEYDQAVNTGQLLGPLSFKRKLLERSGWEVKYLLMKDLAATRKDMWPLLLADLMRLVGQKASAPRVAAGGAAAGKKAGAGARGGKSGSKRLPAKAAELDRLFG